MKDTKSAASAAAALLGRLGGLSTSPAKAAASRANGRKGGRPRKRRCCDCVAYGKPFCYPPRVSADDPAAVCPRFVRVGQPLYRFDSHARSASKAVARKRTSKQNNT